MQNYIDLMKDVILNGEVKGDRTGTGTRSVFGRQLRFNLEDGFPLVTTKSIHFKSVVHELLWMISGSTNVKDLNVRGVKIWDAWADSSGELGPVYGAQWRDSGRCSIGGRGTGVDQLAAVIEEIKTDPNSRRMIVDSWSPQELHLMKLPPCHLLYQFNVMNDKLSCMMTLRSSDIFLGLPFDIASFALLTHMVAYVTGLGVGSLVISMGDTHLYTNHLEQALLQIKRKPIPLPELTLGDSSGGLMPVCIDDFEYEHVHLEYYSPHPAIKGAISV